MLLHLPVGLSSRQTAHRRLSGAHNDRSQSHRQWLAVTAPAGRAYAVERVRLTCRREPRCCQTKQVPKKGVEGRRREPRRRPKKLRFIGRHQKALAHPSLLPLSLGVGILYIYWRLCQSRRSYDWPHFGRVVCRFLGRDIMSGHLSPSSDVAVSLYADGDAGCRVSVSAVSCIGYRTRQRHTEK